MKKIINVVIAINFLILAGCSSTAPVTSNKAGTMSREQVVTVKKATVTAVKNVAIQGRTSNAGKTLGSVTGSILGSTIPVAGSLIGSLIGSAVGNVAEKAVSKKAGLEITLQLEDGNRVVVTQLAETQFKAGDRVQLIMTNNVARVAHLQDNS